MNKPKFETPNLTAANVVKIAELFPGVVNEGKVNFDLLRSMLGEDVFGDEAYEFTWVGKRAAITETGRPVRKTLRPYAEESKNWDTTENLYIEGDNLDVLKLLQESYLGKVKMIYIDPPYNTGNDFVYRDYFKQSREEYEDESGVYDENGDCFYRNTESNGRFHSDWCSMVYPRLVLARNILRNDGAIFVSIDDNEMAQMKKICDEVFGESNFVECIIWKKRATPPNDRSIGRQHEFILCYAKELMSISLGLLDRDEKSIARYSNPDNDIRGDWVASDLSANGKGGRIAQSCVFSIKNPLNDHEYWPPEGKCWLFNKEKVDAYLSEGRIGFREKTGTPYLKRYLSEVRQGITMPTILNDVGFSSNSAAEIDGIFEQKGVFEFAKPVKLLYTLQKIGLVNKDDLILDFFSGSATTAHAVMQLNAEDGGRRKFIMVQLPEPCAEGTEAAKAGYKNICEIGKERIRRAGEKIKREIAGQARNDGEREVVGQARNDGEREIAPTHDVEDQARHDAGALDIGFRVLKLDSTNMNDVYYAASDYTQDMVAMMESNIKPDRNDMDLLYGCLLDWALPLSMPHTHEKIDGFTVHSVGDGVLMACFEEHISETAIREIANRRPLRAVFRDSGFASSPEKINVFEIFKLLAPDTNVKVI